VDKPLKSVTHGQCDARPTATFPAAGHHCPLTGTKLYSLVTEAHVCEQLAQGCYLKARGRKSNPRPSQSPVQCPNQTAHQANSCPSVMPKSVLLRWVSAVSRSSLPCCRHQHVQKQSCYSDGSDRPHRRNADCFRRLLKTYNLFTRGIQRIGGS